MSDPFFRTLRSVEADSLARPFGRVWASAALVALWCGWALGARVAVYAQTTDARVEALDSAHPVQAEVDGSVIAVHGELGATVHEGDVLVELDASDARASLEAATAKQASLSVQRQGLVTQLEGAASARVDQDHVTSAAVAEARAQLASAEAQSGFAEDQAEQAKSMLAAKVGTGAEATRTEAVASQSASARAAAAHRLELLTWDGRLSQTEQLVRESELKREIALVDAELATTAADETVLRRSIARKSIVAPVDGVLAERAPLRPGAVLHVGDSVGSIVPDGGLHVVAQFAPGEVVGRVVPGQLASLHLEGFSWVEYGTVPAVVHSVATEPRDGRIRVELDLVDHDSRVPLQHGLPGALYVEVERVSPARLLLRSVLGAGPGTQ